MTESLVLIAPPGPPAPAERVLPLRRPGRWVATALVLVLVSQAAHGLLTDPLYQWDRFGYWSVRPVILEGLFITLQVAAYSSVLGPAGGILLALGRLSTNPVLRSVSWTYIRLLRSVPLIVVLLFLYNLSALYPTLSIGVPSGPPLLLPCDPCRPLSVGRLAVRRPRGRGRPGLLGLPAQAGRRRRDRRARRRADPARRLGDRRLGPRRPAGRHLAARRTRPGGGSARPL